MLLFKPNTVSFALIRRTSFLLLFFPVSYTHLDDARLKHPQQLSIEQRLERMVYLADEREIHAKYVAGEQLF